MDLSSLAAVATQMSQQNTLASAQLRVLKMAMELESAGALQLVEAATQASAAAGTVGGNIDVYA